MKVRPITLKQANAMIAAFHRHNKPVVGARWAIGAEVDGVVIGVCVVGRTTARMLHSDLTAEVTRLCTGPDAPKNTCSFLYAAARRIWFTMGGTRLLTYTLKSESGASLRGAGWKVTAEIEGAQWGRPSRARTDQTVCAQGKLRWEAVA